jgi:predicted DNA-binding protein (MmcQ/YjbR family)
VLSLDGSLLEGVTFKVTPDEFDELTEIDGIGQAPYFAKRHWVHVADLASLSEPQLQKHISRSHGLVAAGLPKKTQVALGLVEAVAPVPPRRENRHG